MSPLVGRRAPVSIRTVVVLPDPDGPMTPRIVPARIVKSRSRTTTRSPNARDTASTVTTASVASGAGGGDGGGGSAVARSCSDDSGSVTNLLLGARPGRAAWQVRARLPRRRLPQCLYSSALPSLAAGRPQARAAGRPMAGGPAVGRLMAPGPSTGAPGPAFIGRQLRPDRPDRDGARLRHSTDVKAGIHRRRAARLHLRRR